MRELYRVNEQIANLLAIKEVDEDGEYILPDVNALLELQMEQSELVVEALLEYKNTMAEAAMVKNEKLALAKRQSALERKAETICNLVKRVQNGVPVNDPRVRTAYRKTQRVEVHELGHIPDEYLKLIVEPKKTELKKALKAGEVIEGVELIDDVSMSIK